MLCRARWLFCACSLLWQLLPCQPFCTLPIDFVMPHRGTYCPYCSLDGLQYSCLQALCRPIVMLTGENPGLSSRNHSLQLISQMAPSRDDPLAHCHRNTNFYLCFAQGWQFTSRSERLIPASFYGLRRNTLFSSTQPAASQGNGEVDMGITA